MLYGMISHVKKNSTLFKEPLNGGYRELVDFKATHKNAYAFGTPGHTNRGFECLLGHVNVVFLHGYRS